MSAIDFTRATVSGVADAKAESEASAMKSKVSKQLDKKDLKDSMAPPREKKEDKAASKAEKALKSAYIQDVMSKIGAGKSSSSSEESLTPEQKEQIRIQLCSKLSRYYALPQFADRQRLLVTDRTPIDAIKAEIYSLEQTALNPAELFFGATVLLGQVVEKLSVDPKDGRLRFAGMDLRGFSANIAVNKRILEPHLQILAVKYSNVIPVGPWAGLALALMQIAQHTHVINTDPAAAARAAAENTPLPSDLTDHLDASLYENLEKTKI